MTVFKTTPNPPPPPPPQEESFYCFGCDALQHGLDQHSKHVDNCPVAQDVLLKDLAKDLAADAAHEDQVVYGYDSGNDMTSMDAEQQEQEHVVGDSEERQDSD